MKSPFDVTSFAFGATAAVIISQFILPQMGAPVTTLGHPKARADKAFVLAVELQFKSASVAEQLIVDWTRAADW